MVIVGDTGIGKTSIIHKYVNGNNISKKYAHETTLGAIFWRANKEIDKININLNIWDTAGQERFNSLIPMYVRNTDIALLVFDFTNKKSFENLERWMNYLKEGNFKDNMKIMLVGNKTDLNDFILINDEEIKEFLKKNNLGEKYYKTSAKSGTGINELFNDIFKFTFSTNKKKEIILSNSKPTIKVDNNLEDNKRYYCCF